MGLGIEMARPDRAHNSTISSSLEDCNISVYQQEFFAQTFCLPCTHFNVLEYKIIFGFNRLQIWEGKGREDEAYTVWWVVFISNLSCRSSPTVYTKSFHNKSPSTRDVCACPHSALCSCAPMIEVLFSSSLKPVSIWSSCSTGGTVAKIAW